MSQRVAPQQYPSPTVASPYRELWLWWCGAFGFIVVGVMFSWFTLYSLLYGDAERKTISETWTRVPACVLRCDVLRTEAKTRRASVHYHLNLRYSYTYEGVSYASEDAGWYNREDLKVLEKAAREAKVIGGLPDDYLPEKQMCYVNPAQPSQAKFFCRPSSISLVWRVLSIGVGVVLVPLGSVLLCRYSWFIFIKTIRLIVAAVKRG